MTLTLIHAPNTRSFTFLWLLEELEAEYEVRRVTIRHSDGSGALHPDNPHPHGKVPALLHDGALVHEQTAIALYLTDLFPAKGLGPLVGDARRGPYLSWLAYYSGVAEPSFVSKFLQFQVPRGSAGWVDSDEMMAHVIKTLEAGPYLLGERFSAVDMLFGGVFNLFAQSPIMPRSDVITAYVKRCIDRPAFARAQAKDSG